MSSQRRPCLHLLLPIFPRPSLLSCVGTRGISRLSPIIEGIEHNGARYSSNVVMQSRGSRGFGGSFSDGLRANWKKISTSAKHHIKASMNFLREKIHSYFCACSNDKSNSDGLMGDDFWRKLLSLEEKCKKWQMSKIVCNWSEMCRT